MCMYQSKKEVNEQFGRKMNQDVDGNKKFLWKKVSRVNGGKVESCSRIKDENRRLALGEDKVQRIWKYYFVDLCNIDTLEQYAVHTCGLIGIQTGNYFGGEPIRKTDVEMSVGTLKNGKTADKVEVAREMVKRGRDDRVVDWIWRLCNMCFEDRVVPED